MQSLRVLLKEVDPKLYYLLIALFTGGIIYLWRKFSLRTFDLVTRRRPVLQNLPALIISGLMSAAPATGKDIVHTLSDILVGALLGGGSAIFGHHLLKAAPMIPYNGALPKDGTPKAEEVEAKRSATIPPPQPRTPPASS